MAEWLPTRESIYGTDTTMCMPLPFDVCRGRERKRETLTELKKIIAAMTSKVQCRKHIEFRKSDKARERNGWK